MSIKLSICIPTFNRLDDLKTCLGFLAPQTAAAPTGQVEIVIVNNASTDGTKGFIEELASQHSFVRAFHNPQNVGWDGNTAKCIEYAQGEYTALLSDDDFYLEGQVEQILDVLSQREYALIRLNFHTYLENVYQPYQTFQPEKDVFFSNAYEMYDLRRFQNGGHFSGIIYKSDLAKKALAEMMETEPAHASIPERARGVYAELELRIAKTTQLPAYFIGRRLLATSIPKAIPYSGLEHIILDFLRGGERLLTIGVISRDEFELRRERALRSLPQMIVTFTPAMSAADIIRATNELNEYFGNDFRFRFISRPLLYGARLSIVRRTYKLIHRLARFIKRSVVRRSGVLVLR